MVCLFISIVITVVWWLATPFHVHSNFNSKNASISTAERKEQDQKINQRTDTKTSCHVRETVVW